VTKFGYVDAIHDPTRLKSMTLLNLDNHFLAIWRPALNESALDTLTPELISTWAASRGLKGAVAEEQDVGAFAKTKSIVLTVGDKKGCFPKIPAAGNPEWEIRRRAADKVAALWEKVEWFAPLWVPHFRVTNLLSEIEHCSKERAIELFNYHTSTIYILSFQATCIAQIMPMARSLREFCPLAREAYLAFYSGFRASSISSLIPVIEGAITRISSQRCVTGSPIIDKIDGVIDAAINTAACLHFEGMWTPREYRTKDHLIGQDERVFFFETFRRWLNRSFFCNTGQYDGTTWLNRHLFAHGEDSKWQQSGNFCRLVVALATLGAVESWYDRSHNISLVFPEMNDDSKLLWQQALLRGQIQFGLQTLEQKSYQEHGRLVPEMPTDDGALLRQAILSEDCIKDLVRPMREAGWQVDVTEPDEQGLFMTVAANADGETFRAALLFSCATDKAIYRKLAETCDAILYRGAPYRQDQYACGLKVHVGPVAGWQPPPPAKPKVKPNSA
jgi:hypothetical protein